MNPETPSEDSTGAVSAIPSDNNVASEFNTETAAQPDETTTAAPVSRPGRWATALALLALLITLGLCAAGYFFWQQLTETEHLLAQQVEQTESRLTGVQTDTQRLRGEIAGEIEERVKALQTTQQDLLESVRALNAQVRQKTGISTGIAEAEYLVRSANNHLLLDRDVSTAIVALTAADERLRTTGDPDILKVRALLADEINALSTLKLTDTPGLALSLNSLIDSVDQVPLPTHAANLPSAKELPRTEDWRVLLNNIWSALKSLVVIRYDNKTAEPLIAPEQSYFLYQNLRLQLEAARLALLRRDTPTFNATLNTARTWLTTYFDTSAPATKQMLETLARLSKTDISPPLPEISASLKALVELMEDKAATVSAIPVEPMQVAPSMENNETTPPPQNGTETLSP